VLPNPRKLFGLTALVFGLALVAVSLYRPLGQAPVPPWEGGLLAFGSGGVRVTAFLSYDCPHCRRYAVNVSKAFFERYVDTGKVLYTVRLVSWTPLGGALADLAYCVYERRGKEAFLAYDREAALRYGDLELTGADPSELGSRFGLEGEGCPSPHPQRAKDEEMAKAVFLAATPTFFVERKRLMGFKTIGDWEKVLAKEPGE